MMVVRRATLNDKSGLAHILARQNYLHHHLDWRTQFEWLGSQPFWLAEDDDGFLLGALACTQEVPPAAWIRLFCAVPKIKTSAAWQPLFEKVLDDFKVYTDIQIVTLATTDWYKQLLGTSGFNVIQHIVILEWKGPAPKFYYQDPGVTIRLMVQRDMIDVLTLDHLAFKNIWKLSKKTLQLAFNQSSYAAVAEYEKKIVGYQISSLGPDYAHLSRLAVLPDLRRQKIAYQLVGNLLEHYSLAGVPRVTVNTQDDNHASLALYSKLGFVNTGERYPVYSLTPGTS